MQLIEKRKKSDVRPTIVHPEAIHSDTVCHIDQVFGKIWAFTLGLGHIFPENSTRSPMQGGQFLQHTFGGPPVQIFAEEEV